MKFNLAVGGFHHETNTFSPAHTDYNEFLKADGWPGLTRGDELMQTMPALNLPLGGFIQSASEHTLLPTVWANAEPYGPVTANAFDKISEMILDQLVSEAGIDAVYLDLHGAMVTEQSEDGEGQLLKLIREQVGPDIPIAISLDFHANVTPAMFDLSDVITIFRTYPHTDMAETGQRAFHLLERILQDKAKPYKAYRQVPYLIPLSSQHTGSTPCKELFNKLPALTTNAISSVDFACGFPPADIEHCGASIVVYGGDQLAVDSVADDCLNDFLNVESDFTNKLLSANAAVRRAIDASSAGSPIIIADVQDNPGAGGSADTTTLLKALVTENAKNAVLGCLWDADAARLAHAAGCGTQIAISLGGKHGPVSETPMQGDYIVEALSDGQFVCDGAMLGGINLDLGPMALLKVANTDCDVRIAVASERFQCLDQGLFKELGIEPSAQSIVVVKSTVHFRADFEAIAADILLAACPGNHPCDLETVPYIHLRPGVRLGPASNVVSAET